MQIVNDIDKLKKDIAAAKKKKDDLAASIATAKAGKEDSVRAWARAWHGQASGLEDKKSLQCGKHITGEGMQGMTKE
jgi:hypothetical protein